jgi:saccharopine dehydrogenase-like NADP-dependent oxidoreductase
VRVAIVGWGAVGRRVADLLSEAEDRPFETVAALHRHGHWSPDDEPHSPGVSHLSGGALPEATVTVIAVSSGERRLAAAALDLGSHVVCATDDPSEVRALLEMDGRARADGLSLVVGTTMAPGLSCLLASHMRREFDEVDEVHVASLGTGGPGCARRHHGALRGVATDWEDGAWRRRPSGSGRELIWFPEPLGGADCYRAALSDPLLLVPAFPGVRRVTSRLEATRRDRITSVMPMLRPPHPEGLSGAVRVELRGWIAGRAETRILGASGAPAFVSAAVSAQAARLAASGALVRPGAGGLAELVRSPGQVLRVLVEAGVPVAAFEGV